MVCTRLHNAEILSDPVSTPPLPRGDASIDTGEYGVVLVLFVGLFICDEPPSNAAECEVEDVNVQRKAAAGSLEAPCG